MHSKALTQALYNLGNLLTQRSVAAVYGKELAKLRKAASMEDAIARINKLVTSKTMENYLFYVKENAPNGLPGAPSNVLLIDVLFPKTCAVMQLAVLTTEDDVKMPIIACIELFATQEYAADELLHLGWSYEQAFGDSLVYEPDVRKMTAKNVQLRYNFNIGQAAEWAEFDICLDALIMGRLFSPESMALLELAKVPATRP